ncbi:MAG: heat-inducible transcriptional repressor HrcA [Alphaproteobacteria bacterium]
MINAPQRYNFCYMAENRSPNIGQMARINERAQDILRRIVDTYMQTGSPVGSKTLADQLEGALSPATIRNVMKELELTGLLSSPHTSAGRLPTEAGLRLFVNGLMQRDEVAGDDRKAIETGCAVRGRSVDAVLGEASGILAGLSQAAGLVMAPRMGDAPLKHIEFVPLRAGQALAVLVTEDGQVENRVMTLPADIPVSSLTTASNWLNARLKGRNMAELRSVLAQEAETMRVELDALTQQVVEAGVAVEGADPQGDGLLIVKGQSALLQDVQKIEDLDRIRALFEALETRDTLINLVEASQSAEGVQIFIGAENPLFSHSGCAVVLSPWHNEKGNVVGAVGVIGPVRLNYSRIIPMVDYTAQVVSRLLGGDGTE